MNQFIARLFCESAGHSTTDRALADVEMDIVNQKLHSSQSVSINGKGSGDFRRMMFLARSNRASELIMLLDWNPTLIQSNDANEDTVLHVAARLGHSHTVELLVGFIRKNVAYMSLLEGKNKQGDTPLALAFNRGHAYLWSIFAF